MVDLDIIKKVLRKFLTSRRQPGYLKYPEYSGLQEPNTEIYLSSAWLKSHWSWEKFLAFKDGMLKMRRYFTCGFPYQLGVKHNVIDKQRVMDEITENDFDSIAFEMEMGCMPFGESEKAYFKFDKLNKTREIKNPSFPLTDLEYINCKGDRRKHKYYKHKKAGEIRIMGVDVAMMSGNNNDSTVFTYIRCLPSNHGYIKSIEYIETMEGQHPDTQALRLKQLFYDFECDYCVMDTAGNSLGVYDSCTKITFDTHRGIEYQAWTAFNDEKMHNRAFDKNASPVIYSIKVAGSNARQTNHEMAVYTKSEFESKNIRLLVNDIEGKEYIDKIYGLHKLDSDEIARLLSPYFHTTRLISEMINLEMEVREGFIKLREPFGHRKDRYSSLSYALYYIKGIEAEYRVKDDNTDEYEALSRYIFFG